MRKKTKLIEFLILLVIAGGFWVRLIGLNISPYSINFDEAALGYNAYSLMKTGKDEYGRKLPISLRSFNDYKPALYSYLSILPIKIWGLNQFSTRFISALVGSLEIIIFYLLAKLFTKDKKIILLSLIIFSFSPWGIHFSRVAFESNLSAFFFLTGSLLLLTTKTPRGFVFVVLPFVLSLYSYHSARLAAPVLLLCWILDPLGWLLKAKRKKVPIFQKTIPFLLLVLFSLPLVLSKDKTLILTRLRQTNLYYRLYPFVPRELITKSNPWLNLQAHPAYYLGGILTGHIASYFSPKNLSLSLYHWVRNSPQAIPEFSMLGWIFFVIGLVVLLKKLSKSYKYRHLVYWIIAGSLPAALTWTWFHPLRSLNIFPAIMIISLLGIQKTFKSLTKHLSPKLTHLSYLSIVFLLLVSRVFIINNELVYSSWETHGQYQPGGFKDGVPILSKLLQENYQRVIVDTPHAQSYIFFLFYQAFPPEIIQKYANQRPKPGIEGNLNFNFEKYIFRKFDWPKDKNLRQTIFWTSSLIKPEEILRGKNTAIIKIKNVIGNTAVNIITKK